MKRSAICLALVTIMLVLGCASSSNQVKESEIPDWFLNPPKDDNFLFAPGSATSRDMQTSIQKATTTARADLARQVGVKVKTIEKEFRQEIGLAEDDPEFLQFFATATKTIASEAMSGSRAEENKVIREDNVWRAFVLVSYPVGEANAAFLDQLKKHKILKTKFEATKLFEEMDKEEKKLEDFKKEQGQ